MSIKVHYLRYKYSNIVLEENLGKNYVFELKKQM